MPCLVHFAEFFDSLAKKVALAVRLQNLKTQAALDLQKEAKTQLDDMGIEYVSLPADSGSTFFVLCDIVQ